MNRTYPVFAFALTLAACGSGESSGAGGSTSSAGAVASAGAAGEVGGAPAGAAHTGGSSTSGGQSNTGGSTAHGGHTSTAGSGAGGKVEPGNPCTSGCPSGTVNACWGGGCPFGECDDSGFLADAACTDTYSGALSSSSVYCTANENAGYCLLTVTSTLEYWAVNCVNGTPQVTNCPSSCGLSTQGVAGC